MKGGSGEALLNNNSNKSSFLAPNPSGVTSGSGVKDGSCEALLNNNSNNKSSILAPNPSGGTSGGGSRMALSKHS